MAKKNELKPITFKFRKVDRAYNNQPTIMVEGIHPAEEMPKQLMEVMTKYGFDYDQEDLFIDCIAPQGDTLQEEMDVLAGVIPVTVSAEGRGNKLTYWCNIDDRDNFRGHSPYEAMTKAFKDWNKLGRPINGMMVSTALDRVLETINKKRGVR